ncbi:GntR family transcriptional regulator [Planctomyces sp. SH-PL14]|uniref:GntR family transcriptional regulator n=1 Tax=Planctomyces sp. SH-PL14 TaxID=1632864 RepID=UPI00078D3ADB|nr:GntR family transcriptional regulator [Planctomyces sp. SH-PL14]AMV16902.1 HTH-type transcriptional repressor YtrA [Planctomyces sp. SH-PL14]
MQRDSLQFQVSPTSGIPIYRQIMDQVRALIAGGKAQPGDVLPSVRQMAADLGVNMMTVSKAYAKLEAEQVVERARGKGMVIAAALPSGSIGQRQDEIRPHLEPGVVRGRQLGLSDGQILDVVKELLRDTNHE